MEQTENKNIKKSIRTIIIVGICIIAVIVAALVYFDFQYHFMKDTAIFLTLSLSLCSILVATLGINITYRIQTTIASINARNRENDSFFNKLQLYMQRVEAINQTYQTLAGTTNPMVQQACANTISTQAVLAYNALKDVENSSFYQKNLLSKTELEENKKELLKYLENMADCGALVKAGLNVARKDIDANIDPINDYSAQFRIELNKVLYPGAKDMEDRIV